MENTTNQAAKYAFFYMLSLVALIFMALSTGMIIFQIINKSLIDVLEQFRGRFSPDQLKFAISALIIATPIYFITMRQIYKSLVSGALAKDAGVRRWLTYFILFVSSVVMLGWLIATINSFLDGELTTKFILKSITAIGIAASIFTFYLYDIRREEVKGKKDKTISLYFYGSLAVIIAVFTVSLFFVESPTETRNRKFDNAILNKFSQIDSAISDYYFDNKTMPESLGVLEQEFNYISEEDLVDPATREQFKYQVLEEKKYELCATFRTSSKDDETMRDEYLKERWPHEAGEQCIAQRVIDIAAKEGIRPVPVD